MPLSYKELTQPSVEPVSLAQAKQHLRVDFTDDDAYISALITASRQRVEKITNRSIFNREVLLTLDAFPWPGWGGTASESARNYFFENYYARLVIKLPLPATVSVQSLTYLANDGVTVVTIDPSKYVVDTTSEPARISPVPGYTWPYQQNYVPGQVRVNFTAGTYELPVTENFTVPAQSPYTYTLQQAAKLITLTGVTNTQSAAVTYTSDGSGTLTFDASLAGQMLTASYTVNNCPQTIIFSMLLLMKHWYDNREAASADPLKEIPLGVADLLASEAFDTCDW